ncbi:MAG: GGDEF domain-containing protein [Burkholderiales bacterium]|nr:GGDEF domain-containing protein [Burkholderiales bacterium]
MDIPFEPTSIEDPRRRRQAGRPAHGRPGRVLTALKPWVAWSIGVAPAWLASTAYMEAGPGGPAQPFFLFCLGITLVYFALLILAARFGAAIRRNAQRQKGWIDLTTGLYNRSGMVGRGGEMLADCRREGRALSIAVFDWADLLEVRTIYGNRVSRKLMDRVVRKMAALAGEHGMAVRTGPVEFTVLMPMTREKARRAVTRVLGDPGRIELDAGDSEIVLVPDCALEGADGETASVGGLYKSICVAMAARKQDEDRRRHHMQRDRERHSRPMSLPWAADSRPLRVPSALTVPMPLTPA